VAQLLPGPVLPVVGELALNRFLIDAPDLADWYAASFAFARETEPSSPPDIIAISDAPSELSRSLIEARIALLEQQRQLSDLRSESEARIYLELARLYYELPRTAPAPGVSQGVLGPAGVREKLEASANSAAKAAELLRPFAGRGPAYQGRLGQALTILSLASSELGEWDQALETAHAAADLYRELKDRDPDTFLPGFAMSLNNYATMSSRLGKREAALVTSGEAVKVFRQLALSQPAAFEAKLAAALVNHSAIVSPLGPSEATLSVAREAVQFYRRLDPNGDTVGLAKALSNYASTLSAVGQFEPALVASRDAVDGLLRLAQIRPDQYRANFAMALSNFSQRLADVGQREAALAAAREALDIRRQLACANPGQSLPDLATSLAVLGQITDDPTESIALFHEAITQLRPLFLQLPQAHSSLMTKLGRSYLELCQAYSTAPDPALLALITEKLQPR